MDKELRQKAQRVIYRMMDLTMGQLSEDEWATLGVYFGVVYRESKLPTIVTLCGSTRFSDAFHEANLRETLAGKIVLTVGCDFKSDTDLMLAGELTAMNKKRLDELHLRKIDLCQEILVLNVNGYIGESTRREIAYAEAHGKTIRYLEQPGDAFQEFKRDARITAYHSEE